MTTLTCPKCRLGMPDEALDAGQCPACGFPLDGPIVLGPSPSGKTPWVFAVGAIAILALAGFGGYAYFSEQGKQTPQPALEVATIPPAPQEPIIHLAPFPHEPKQPAPGDAQGANGDKGQPPPQPPMLGAIEVPKRDGPRPIGVVMKVDPKIAPVRKFDHPDDTAALPDLNSSDRVVLTGRLRGLRLGSINGKGSIDASGLAVEEVFITGDLNNEASVKLNAPNGKVIIGGYVVGNSKLTISAPGGEVVIAANSGRLGGGSTTTITAQRVQLQGQALGGAKLNLTLTAGGAVTLAKLDGGAVVTYKKAAPTDPPITIAKGEIRGGARVIEMK